MPKRKRGGLRDEGEAVLTVNFNPDPAPDKFRIVIPATDAGPETCYDVVLSPHETDPDLANIYLASNGAFVGTMTRPQPVLDDDTD